jgi:hypothetical protein
MTHHLNNKRNNNNHHLIIAVAMSIFTLATMVASATMSTATVASTITATSNTTTTTASTSASPSGIELSQQPIYQEHVRTVSETPINEAHMSVTFSGNGTLTLSNTTQPINFTSSGSALISFVTLSSQGTETFITENGETATATFYEIAEFNPTSGQGKGFVIAVFHTNPTGGILAPLNGMIAAGIDNIQPNGESLLTLWKWKSGIRNLDITSVQGVSPMDDNILASTSEEQAMLQAIACGSC